MSMTVNDRSESIANDETRDLSAMRLRKVTESTKPCGEFDLEQLRVFCNCMMAFVRSPMHQQHLAEGLSRILSVDQDEIYLSRDCFYDLACAKLVLECSILTSPELYVRVCDHDYGIALKETCFCQFASHYGQHMSNQGDSRELTSVTMTHLQLYDDAIDAFSKEGVGQLLARRIMRRLNHPPKSISEDVVENLIAFLDEFFVHHFWQRLQKDSDVMSPEALERESIC